MGNGTTDRTYPSPPEKPHSTRRHTHSLAHKATHSETHTKAHARTDSHLETCGARPHSGPAQLRAGTAVRLAAPARGVRSAAAAGAHDGPAPRLQTFRSSPRTDLQKHFDNHLPRGLTPPPRAGPGTPEGAAAKPPPRLLRTGNLSRPAGSSAGGNLARR